MRLRLYKIGTIKQARVTFSQVVYEGEVIRKSVYEEKVGRNWVGNRLGIEYSTVEEANEAYLEYRHKGFKKEF